MPVARDPSCARGPVFFILSTANLRQIQEIGGHERTTYERTTNETTINREDTGTCAVYNVQYCTGSRLRTYGVGVRESWFPELKTAGMDDRWQGWGNNCTGPFRHALYLCQQSSPRAQVLNAIDSTLRAVVSIRCLGAELKLPSALWGYCKRYWLRTKFRGTPGSRRKFELNSPEIF